MRFGVCLMANIDEIGFFRHAESLGFDSVWVTDSQMLFSDCYAVPALAAAETRLCQLLIRSSRRSPAVSTSNQRRAERDDGAGVNMNRLAGKAVEALVRRLVVPR